MDQPITKGNNRLVTQFCVILMRLITIRVFGGWLGAMMGTCMVNGQENQGIEVVEKPSVEENQVGSETLQEKQESTTDQSQGFSSKTDSDPSVSSNTDKFQDFDQQRFHQIPYSLDRTITQTTTQFTSHLTSLLRQNEELKELVSFLTQTKNLQQKQIDQLNYAYMVSQQQKQPLRHRIDGLNKERKKLLLENCRLRNLLEKERRQRERESERVDRRFQ